MKKLNLWLLASLFVAAFTLTACGSDGDNTPSGPTSIEGKWHANVPKWGEDLCSRYNHEMTYEFKSDKTFTILADWSGGGEDKQQFRFTGSYTAANGTVTLNMKKAEFYYNGNYVEDKSALNFMWDEYDPQTKSWSFDWQSDIDPSAVALPYSITGTKMEFGDPNKHLVFHNHGLLTATLDWMGK